VSATSCVAVGFYYKAPRARTLVESWDGVSWSLVPSPNVTGAGRNDHLISVSCATATACIAVGDDRNASPGNGEPLVESWDGASWSITPTPDPGSFGALSSISCVSSTSCVATGYLYDQRNNYLNLAEVWDGANWTITPTPNPGGNLNELTSVSCTSSTNCVAAGAYDGAHKVRTLAEVWDGANWTVTPTPNTSTSENYLYGTSCFGADTCFAVGFSIRGTLILSGQ